MKAGLLTTTWLMLAVSAGPTFAQPAAEPPTPPDDSATESMPEESLSDYLVIEREGEGLAVKVQQDRDAQPRRVEVNVPGFFEHTTVELRPLGVKFISHSGPNFGVADHSLYLEVRDQSMTIQARGIEGQPPGETAAFSQSRVIDERTKRMRDEARLTVGLGDNRRSLRGANLAQLRIEHAEVVDRYLRPVLRKLDAESVLVPSAKVATIALAEPMKAEQLKRIVAQRVAELDADSYSDRQAATDALRALGPQAADALREVDQTKLSEEQRSRLNTVLDDFKNVQLPDLSDLRNNRHFLLDCLLIDDADVRVRALEVLRKNVDHPVTFDVDADPAARAEAVAELRRKLCR
jgi:hypothetical protein